MAAAQHADTKMKCTAKLEEKMNSELHRRRNTTCGCSEHARLKRHVHVDPRSGDRMKLHPEDALTPKGEHKDTEVDSHVLVVKKRRIKK